VSPNTQYTYTVSAFDAAGNESAQSVPATVTTPPIATSAPPVPVSLQASGVSSSLVTLSWMEPAGNVAAAGFQIFRNGVQIGTAPTTSYTDTALTASTTYTYTVAGYGYSNLASAQSQPVVVTTTVAPKTPPSLVQVTQNQIGNGTSVSVAFNAPTTPGNTIVAYVIWSNTASATLTDSRGDAFVSVSPPTAWGGSSNAQIFYASNIAGGANTVTVSFRNAVSSYGVIYVHEYAGISPSNPVDVTVAASGSGPSLNSGSATTTTANDLIFGAGVSSNVVTAAGSGFISRDVAYGNITEDETAGSAGVYAATATHNGSSWGMQLVAFRPAN
jgi:hypothetical protein